MNSIVYDFYTVNSKLPWKCLNCAIKNISFSVFDNLADLLQSPVYSSSLNFVSKKGKTT